MGVAGEGPPPGKRQVPLPPGPNLGKIIIFAFSGRFFRPFLLVFPKFPLPLQPNMRISDSQHKIKFIMLAVVKIAGQQFKVQKDQTLYVPRIAGNAGDKVEFGEVLLSIGDDVLSIGKDVKAVVKAEIVGHVQGDKVIAFKMKRRKGFRKKHGHRTHYTKIKISEIA